MLAHLVLIIGTLAGPVEVRIPFADLAACEAFMADPMPLLVNGPLAGPQRMPRCVNGPTVPGKPV